MNIIDPAERPVIFRAHAGNAKKIVGIPWQLKRWGDIAVASMLLLLMAPVMLILFLVVRLGSPGPAIFAHDRVGLDGQIFKCLKYRTMHVDAGDRLAKLLAADPDAAAEWALRRKLDRDPRITAIGQWLRSSSLDELPQLVNVLRGEMSIVGPRPVTEDELLRYGICARWYVSVRPGITGLWQISGRNAVSYGERVELDRRYAANWSLFGDLFILLRTPAAVLLRRGAQ